MFRRWQTLGATRQAVALGCLAIGFAAFPARGEATPDDDPLPLLQPTIVHELPNEAALSGIVANEDGSRLFGTYGYETVNAWEVLVYIWPEMMVGVAIIFLGVVMWRILRRRRLARAVGVPYCRKCNYRLTGAAEAHCPECGADLSKRRAKAVGRPARLRFALLGTLAVGVFCTTCIVYVIDPPRRLEMSQRYEWPSTSLRLFLKDRGILNRFTRTVVRQLVEYDPIDQCVVRVFEQESEEFVGPVSPWPGTELYSQPIQSPDGRWLAAEHGLTMFVWSVADGGLQLEADFGERGVIGSIAFSPDSRSVYVAADPFDVWAWDVKTGEDSRADHVTIIREPSDVTNPDDWPFGYYWDLKPQHERLHVFSWNAAHSQLIRFDDRFFQQGRRFDPNFGPALAVEFASTSDEWFKRLIDLPKGMQSMNISVLDLGNTGQRWFAKCSLQLPSGTDEPRDRILGYDSAKGRWFVDMDVSLFQHVYDTALSRDRRRLFVTGSIAGDTTGRKRLLLVFDLPRD